MTDAVRRPKRTVTRENLFFYKVNNLKIHKGKLTNGGSSHCYMETALLLFVFYVAAVPVAEVVQNL